MWPWRKDPRNGCYRQCTSTFQGIPNYNPNGDCIFLHPKKRNLFFGHPVGMSSPGITYIICFSLIKFALMFFEKFPTFMKSDFFKLQNHAKTNPATFFLKRPRCSILVTALFALLLGYWFRQGSSNDSSCKITWIYRQRCPVGCVFGWCENLLKIIKSLQQRWEDWNWTNFLHGSWLCTAPINFSPMFWVWFTVSKGCDNIRGHETCKALADGLSQLWQICWETHRQADLTGWSWMIVELILTRIGFGQSFSGQYMMSSNIFRYIFSEVFCMKFLSWRHISHFPTAGKFNIAGFSQPPWRDPRRSMRGGCASFGPESRLRWSRCQLWRFRTPKANHRLDGAKTL